MSEINSIQKKEQITVAKLVDSPSVKKRIEDLLGKRAPQFVSAMIQISNDSKMDGCSPVSIIGSAMTAASLDLPINQNLGFAYIVPYNNYDKVSGTNKKEAQFQLGTKGFIQLAIRSGQYIAMNDCVVPCGVLVGQNRITGDIELDWSKEKEGDPDGYAFYFKMINGFEKTAFMTRKQCIDHGKRYSKSFQKGFGLWVDNPDAMCSKTVIKLTMAKYGLLSVQLQKALETDQAIIDDEGNERFPDNEKQASGITVERNMFDPPAESERDEKETSEKVTVETEAEFDPAG